MPETTSADEFVTFLIAFDFYWFYQLVYVTFARAKYYIIRSGVCRNERTLCSIYSAVSRFLRVFRSNAISIWFHFRFRKCLGLLSSFIKNIIILWILYFCSVWTRFYLFKFPVQLWRLKCVLCVIYNNFIDTFDTKNSKMLVFLCFVRPLVTMYFYIYRVFHRYVQCTRLLKTKVFFFYYIITL